MKFSRRLRGLLIVLFWLIVWQAAAVLINQRLLLVSPLDTAKALARLVPTRAFWHRIGFSAGRILTGFSLALVVGCLFAVLAHTSRLLRELLAPVMQLVKATPVASFIILALLWVRGKNLSILISFLMVLPVVYSSILEGLSNLDWQLGEMARVFRIPWGRRVRCIWLPQIWPYLIQSCRVGLGICWKSGVAAEVIGLPSGSLGDALYQAKIYLQTDDLFAWTFVIVCASALFEQCFLWLLRRIGVKLMERDGLC